MDHLFKRDISFYIHRYRYGGINVAWIRLTRKIENNNESHTNNDRTASRKEYGENKGKSSKEFRENTIVFHTTYLYLFCQEASDKN